jgi:hypothetical protein
MTAGGRVDLTRRPSAAFLAWASVLGLVLGAGCTVLILGVMAEPSPWVATAAGLALGALVPLSVAGGSRVVIADGRLTYFLRGQPSVTCLLADVRGFRVIEAGQLRGIGVEVEPTRLEFLSRKGVTLRTCEAHYAGSGCGLVLEFFRAEDVAALETALSRA